MVDEETVRLFRTEGVTVIRNVFADWVETLRRGVDENIADPDPTRRIYKGDTGGGDFFVDYCNWRRIPGYRDFIFDSPAADIAATLLNSRTIRLFHEHVLVKFADSGVVTPWHHDLPYYCVEGPKTVSLWIPLDEVPRERTLEFVPGSHLWGKAFRPKLFSGKALNEDDGLEELPDIDADREGFRVTGWALTPGDAVAFDYRTIHGAPANRSLTEQRRAFSLRLVGDGARFRRREGIKTSPPFADVKLADGAPLDGEDFPVLFPRGAQR
jgi:ectoine hydroxylase-related dioxygenase (phytanoyl-CoA dioxygenase family)